VPAEEIPAYLSLPDLTVDPVRDDLVAQARAPLKIVESLAVGKPVVTGDVGDRRETLAGGQAGMLVQPGSAPDLAAGMLHVLGNTDLMRALSEGALAQRQRFYWDRLVEKVIELYGSHSSRS
jgi:glycosyltransferase involved in cell wall biosynthesis